MEEQIKCEDFVKKYLSFLDKGFSVQEWEKGCIINTPFIGYSTDAFRVYIEDLGSGYLKITDLGDTWGYLESFELDKKGKIARYFKDIQDIYRIEESNGELFKKTVLKDFGEELNLFLCGIQVVSHLEFEKQPSREVIFRKQIEAYCTCFVA